MRTARLARNLGVTITRADLMAMTYREARALAAVIREEDEERQRQMELASMKAKGGRR